MVHKWRGLSGHIQDRSGGFGILETRNYTLKKRLQLVRKEKRLQQQPVGEFWMPLR